MSVVVATVDREKIVVASDSGCYQGRGIVPTANLNISKLERVNDTILGGVGLAEENHLFFDYMRTHILDVVDVEHIRTFIKGFIDYKQGLGLNAKLENEYILAAKGKCYNIQGMLIIEIDSSWAIGAGADYANGALYMHATAYEAVEAAKTLCAYVGGAIRTETMGK